MTIAQMTLFGIFGAVFVLLIWGRWRYDLIAFAALLVGVLSGVVPSDQAFTGFGHPATLVVALVLIVSGGLVNSGAVQLITRSMVDSTRSLGGHIVLMGGIGAVLSAFMNNVAALALLMPVDVQTAKKAKRDPGLSLMPLSFATILGGMVTMIGTPPNIIIATIREDAFGEPFSMFDFAPGGLVAAMAGLIYVATIGWRLIPSHRGTEGATENLIDIASYVAELTLPKGSKLVGQKVHELYGDAEKADVAILGMIRAGNRLYGTSRNREMQEGDVLVMEATPEALDEFRTTFKLDFADPLRQNRVQAAGAGLGLIEVVVTENARIRGKTALAIGLNWRHNTILMGISRRGKKSQNKFGAPRLCMAMSCCCWHLRTCRPMSRIGWAVCPWLNAA